MSELRLPASVAGVGERAFDGCSALERIYVDGNNCQYCSLDGVLFTKDKTTLVQYPAGKKEEEYAVPDGVTAIGGDAFQDCRSLKTVAIPDSVTSIVNGAFMRCSSLESIILPEGVTSVGMCTFSNCPNLRKVVLPGSVVEIDHYAFEDSENVTIFAPAGSYAEEFAKKENMKFESIE